MKRQIIDRERCTGCGACKDSCHFQAISMELDKEGFFYPVINSEKCTGCNACVAVCSHRTETGEEIKHTYIVRNSQNAIRKKSTSGGIFTALADYCIKEGGYVFGAAFNEKLEVCHIEVCDYSELARLRKSKYVQSNLGNTYHRVKELLENGELVLYTGTPCQIAGLKAFLGKDYDNLICVDLICHGVPSPGVWEKYLEYIGSSERIVAFDFRSKEKGWKSLNIEYEFADKRHEVVDFSKDSYMCGFEQTEILRPVCYNCDFRGSKRYSDITLGDCWGYGELMEKEDDDTGVSVAIINTERGEDIYKNISCFLEQDGEIDLNKLKKYNKNLFFNPIFTSKRSMFFKEFSVGNYKKAFELLQSTDRRDAYVEILSKWLESKLENKNVVSDHLISINCRRIAIYGMGMLGRFLWKELSLCSEIDIVLCMDSNAESIKDIEVVNSNSLEKDMFKDIDGIIVTPVHVKALISGRLAEYFDGTIIGIDEILDF